MMLTQRVAADFLSNLLALLSLYHADLQACVSRGFCCQASSSSSTNNYHIEFFQANTRSTVLF
jgi:hypothetical protein